MSGSSSAVPGNHGRVGEGIEELAQAADQLFYAMRRSRTATAGQFAASLSMAQLALLDPLADVMGGEGLPVSTLAAAADVTLPTATRMLQQLETKNVVTRRRSLQDGRQVLVRLTQEGAQQLTAMRENLRVRQFTVLARFTPDERHQLAAQIQRLAALINDTTA
jgi:DNA-binding MarR family transcriptional regulator